MSACIKGTELTVKWPQPRCPLHAPKLLWSRFMKAKVGRKPEQSRPKWDDTGLSVLFEKRMLHLWLVALCVHVVMWSSIRPSSHRYHGNSATHAQCVSPLSGSEPVGFLSGTRGNRSYDGLLWVLLSLLCLLLSLTGCDQNRSLNLQCPIKRWGRSPFFVCIHHARKLRDTTHTPLQAKNYLSKNTEVLSTRGKEVKVLIMQDHYTLTPISSPLFFLSLLYSMHRTQHMVYNLNISSPIFVFPVGQPILHSQTPTQTATCGQRLNLCSYWVCECVSCVCMCVVLEVELVCFGVKR